MLTTIFFYRAAVLPWYLGIDIAVVIPSNWRLRSDDARVGVQDGIRATAAEPSPLFHVQAGQLRTRAFDHLVTLGETDHQRYGRLDGLVACGLRRSSLSTL